MKLQDLVEALAKEIDLIAPEMALQLEQLGSLEASDPLFFDIFDQYSGQVQRMGEAAAMAGFAGLEAVCGHVLENALLLATAEPQARYPVMRFLQQWPALVVSYLRNLDDAHAATHLVRHLETAPRPLEDGQDLSLMYQLGAMPMQVGTAGLGAASEHRPILASAQDVELVIPADVDAALLEGFFQEAPDQVRHLLTLVRGMVEGVQDADAVSMAKRIAHTLKGTGATVGLRGIAALGHHFEDILEHFSERGASVSLPVANTLLDAAYCLEQMIAYLSGADEFPQQAQMVLQEVLDMVNRIERGEDVDIPLERAGLYGHSMHKEGALVAAAPTPAPALASAVMGGGATFRVSAERVEELFRLSGETMVHSAVLENQLLKLSEHAHALVEQNLRVQQRLFELETVVDLRTMPAMHARNKHDGGTGFDPLEMDQYNELHSTTHALVEEVADVRELARRVEDGIAQLDGMQTRQQILVRDLQHLVMGTRMAEVATLESRLQRNVRNTCQMTGKQASLQLMGGDTQMDSELLNRLAEPLLHLVRNAIDHGIETVEERRKLGKPDAGLLKLRFTRQGQQIVLFFEDDGRGLDPERIYQRALDKGLISRDQDLSAEEIVRLILLPGFTTRDNVSEVSGRGIGLDVVRDWITSVNGSMRIHNTPAQGCIFELRFAASLLTQQSLVVEVAQQRFALPSVLIEQAVSQGMASYDKLANKTLFQMEGRVIPAHFLHQLVGLPVDTAKPLQAYNAVIVHVHNKEYVLLVDVLLDSRELLVKEPGRFVRHMPGIAGWSVLGDGSVAVNLDIAQLLDTQVQPAAVRNIARGGSVNKQNQQEKYSVLIVDDALTVRNTLQQFFQDAGWVVETARDGVEAVKALASFRPHVVLTDLEMPNMNGVELTTHMQSNDNLKTIPVIMITSRSQEKHRRLAEKAGVHAYLTKPYNEDELLRIVRSAVAA